MWKILYSHFHSGSTLHSPTSLALHPDVTTSINLLTCHWFGHCAAQVTTEVHDASRCLLLYDNASVERGVIINDRNTLAGEMCGSEVGMAPLGVQRIRKLPKCSRPDAGLSLIGTHPWVRIIPISADLERSEMASRVFSVGTESNDDASFGQNYVQATVSIA